MCIDEMLKQNARARDVVADIHIDLASVELTDRPLMSCLVAFCRAYICLLVSCSNILLAVASCSSCCMDIQRMTIINQLREGRYTACVSVILFGAFITVYAGVVLPYYIFLLLLCIGVSISACLKFCFPPSTYEAPPAATPNSAEGAVDLEAPSEGVNPADAPQGVSEKAPDIPSPTVGEPTPVSYASSSHSSPTPSASYPPTAEPIPSTAIPVAVVSVVTVQEVTDGVTELGLGPDEEKMDR